MSYRHDLVEALFHSTCGGRTVSSKEVFGGAVPYLVPATCGWCKASPRHRWKVSFSLAELSKRLSKAGLAKGTVRTVQKALVSTTVKIRDTRGTHRLEPRKLRRSLGFSKLFSERFSAETRSGRVYFAGMGFGHGVGLCQWGAHGQAAKGRSYRQILATYYPKVQIKRLY